jgi:hypothetical protein
MSKRRGARYNVIGKGCGSDRVYLCLDDENEVATMAAVLAGMLGQSPVAVIDRGRYDKAVTFYFADCGVCSVVRMPTRGAAK